MRGMFYDREGNEITAAEWSELKLRCMEGEHKEIAIVAQEEIGGHEVSTVWLGMNMNFTGEGPPLIFETMLFPEYAVLARYATEEEALLGHLEAVGALTRPE